MRSRNGPWLALKINDDPLRADRLLRRAHEQFVATHTAPASVRSVIVDSWQRSARAGVVPDGGELPQVRMARNDLEEYRSRHALAPLLPIFRDLLADLATDGEYIVAIADAEGTLLWVDGDATVRHRAERMNFVEGAEWAEAQAGTNAPGTALALGHAVQIFASEHFSTMVQPWSCAAAPIRDPDGGSVLGVIDITGGQSIAMPHALSLVQATARVAQTELAHRQALRDKVACEQFLDRLPGGSPPVALVSRGGRVLHATPDLTPAALRALLQPDSPTAHHTTQPRPPGKLAAVEGMRTLPDGRPVVVEPIGRDGHLLVRLCNGAGTQVRRAPAPTTARLTALGRDAALLEVGGRTHRLRPRHSEILVVLAAAGRGVSGERLAVDLSEDEVHPVTLRAEMSRLRALVGADLLGSRPYELRQQVHCDFLAVRDLLARGEVGDALANYPGPLLPSSVAPAVVEFRAVLEQQLRGAVLASGDPRLLRRWVDSTWGGDDGYAWETLARHLPLASPQRAAAASRARALLGTVVGATVGRATPSPPAGRLRAAG